uniref:Uncharacterized protein n=1 Tax=Lygus hesperus TaxID=30085 RepID=A0A146MGT5_LYGHE
MVEACALQLIESSYLIHSEENSKIDDVSLSVAPTHLSLNAYSCCGKSILYACLCYKLFLIFNTIKSSVPLLSTITESSFVPISLIVQITSHHYSSRGSCELCSTLSSCPTEEAKCEVAHHGSNRDQIEVQSSVATHLRNTASPIVRLQPIFTIQKSAITSFSVCPWMSRRSVCIISTDIQLLHLFPILLVFTHFQSFSIAPVTKF